MPTSKKIRVMDPLKNPIDMTMTLKTNSKSLTADISVANAISHWLIGIRFDCIFAYTPAKI